jgi:predicted amidophosphoribosyltransferase
MPKTEPRPPETLTCASCGGKIEPDDLVCPHCGEPLAGG